MNPENIPEFRQIGNKQPKAHELLMQMAVKSLSPKQQQIWLWWNNDKLTQDEIAEALNITQQGIQQQIKTIENKLIRYCKLNMGAYLLLKVDQELNKELTNDE